MLNSRFRLGAMNWRLFIAILWGALFGVLTFAAGPLAVVSNDTAIATAQIALRSPMIPGLIVAAFVGSLVPAAGLNAVINFAICYFMLRFFPAFKPDRDA